MADCEWDSEPDQLDFEHAGLPCKLRRGPFGHWCGYVGVSKNHPLHGVRYSDICDALRPLLDKRMQSPIGLHPSMSVLLTAAFGGDFEPTPSTVFLVHGGITYSENGWNDDHRADWWLGFDCNHCDDLSPELYKTKSFSHGIYQNMDYARKECESLAEQISSVTP